MKGGSKAVRITKELSAAAIGGVIVTALVLAGNYSGTTAVITGILAFLLFALVLLAVMDEI